MLFDFRLFSFLAFSLSLVLFTSFASHLSSYSNEVIYKNVLHGGV